MVDIDELAARAVADPPAKPLSLSELTARASRRRRRQHRRVGLAAVLVVLAGMAGAIALDRSGSRTGSDDDASVVANGSTVPGTAGAPNGSNGSNERVALDALLDRPARPEDEFPDLWFTQWGWEPDLENNPMDARLDFAASRSVTIRQDVPAFVVPTFDRDGVCIFTPYPPPRWWPDDDSTIPGGCADAAAFNAEGITFRNCGPGDRWVAMSLVPIGVDPDDVAPYGELDRSGAAILFDSPPVEPVDLHYADGHTIRVSVPQFGHLPGDGWFGYTPGNGTVPCPPF
jgi:hypothetical protein